MTARQHERANKVVESFRAVLDKKALEAIPDSDFEQLSLIVQQALSEELQDAAEEVEALAHKLRAGTVMGDVGMGFM
ncbi:MAG: hypothetical protein R6X15_02170 [Pseudomonadota bacterium]